MVTLATPSRRSRFAELFEELGFEMNTPPEAARHQLVRPIGLRLIGLEDQLPDERGIRPSPLITEGDDYLFWEGFELEDVDPRSTNACLWDFIEMVDASPQDGLRFVQRWGLLSATSPDGGWSENAPWDEAYSAREFLIAMAVTGAGELLPEDRLWWLSLGEGREERDADSGEMRRRLSSGGSIADEIEVITNTDLRNEVEMDRWRRIRREGGGLDMQRRLLSRILDSQIEFRPTVSVWDERGRRVERLATGVDEIVWSHIHTFFASSQTDLYVCAFCGRPYEFSEGSAKRRPRRAASSYCSDNCRREARRQSNRESWKRNSQKWRPRGSRRKNDDAES